MGKSRLMKPASGLVKANLTSKNSFISILFRESRSKEFDLVLQVANSTSGFQEKLWKSKNTYAVKVGLDDPAELSKVSFILSRVLSWTGTAVFLNDLPCESYEAVNIRDTIQCYLNSLQCDDRRAHCVSEIDHPNNYRRKRKASILVPCRKIENIYGAFSGNTQTSLPDQSQALAVREKCHFCPNFDKNRTELVEHGGE